MIVLKISFVIYRMSSAITKIVTELENLSWQSICVQSSDLSNPLLYSVVDGLSEHFSESVVTVLNPTECCLNYDCALHHETPIIVALDICCPHGHFPGPCPVLHFSLQNPIIPSSSHDLLPPTTILLYEKHKEPLAQASGLPPEQCICVNGGDWIHAAETANIIALYEDTLKPSHLMDKNGYLATFLVELFLLPDGVRQKPLESLLLITSHGTLINEVSISDLEKDLLQFVSTEPKLLRSRMSISIDPPTIERVGIIIGDACAETLRAGKTLRMTLKQRDIQAYLCFFGSRLDESKLGNFAHQVDAFVFLSSCPLLSIPWLNSSFRRVSQHYVPVLTLFELRYALNKELFAFQLDPSLTRGIEYLASSHER
ncbi:putative Diphthamide-ammonia ligase [Giardia muris]|uniref:Putative Diphthamide-ammonia ligase n=1 Tax=Giardia muris TaxID=5742 RepID=A0A4Z1T326_GIAMU|nr:putative Diphthamide-ammonia ligase [Giardia muris]|eukprot:TNJ28343.1 putative Diphthamide-ammonia ligase [Giardia muris]